MEEPSRESGPGDCPAVRLLSRCLKETSSLRLTGSWAAPQAHSCPSHCRHPRPAMNRLPIHCPVERRKKVRDESGPRSLSALRPPGRSLLRCMVTPGASPTCQTARHPLARLDSEAEQQLLTRKQRGDCSPVLTEEEQHNEWPAACPDGKSVAPKDDATTKQDARIFDAG